MDFVLVLGEVDRPMYNRSMVKERDRSDWMQYVVENSNSGTTAKDQNFEYLCLTVQQYLFATQRLLHCMKYNSESCSQMFERLYNDQRCSFEPEMNRPTYLFANRKCVFKRVLGSVSINFHVQIFSLNVSFSMSSTVNSSIGMKRM